TSGAGVILSNTRNLVLKDITIDVSSSVNPCIVFTDACTNIVVRDCRLLAADTITVNSLSAPVYKGTRTGIVDSLFFINNLLDGGYTGFSFCGGFDHASEWGSNIVFDSNTISNSYYYGLYAEYTDFVSCASNTILSRRANTGVNWYGIQIYNSKGSLIGNRIMQRSNTITSPYGIYSSMHNLNYPDMPFRNRALIANNEIILNTTTTYSGIYVTNSRSEIINNSICISGTGISRGIYLDNAKTTKNDMVIKNNNIAMIGAYASYPVYFSDTGNLALYNIDYNNYYASQSIGYYGKQITNMLSWRDLIPTDKHSIKILPSFIDTVSLELASYSGFACPVYPSVTTDIKGSNRNAITVTGAYNGVGDFPLVLDLGIKKIICDTVVVYPQVIPLKIEIQNEGFHLLVDSATFGWSINGLVQPSHTWIASTPLEVRNKIEILVGSFDPVQRTNAFNIVVWIERVNGKFTDSIRSNDTAKVSVKILYTGSNLHTLAVEQLVPNNVLCTDDSTWLNIKLQNTGTVDHDFSLLPVTFNINVTTPDPFNSDTVISTGTLKAGETVTLGLTNRFPLVVAGEYDIKVWMDSVSHILYDDTLLYYFVSGKFGLPIDEYFSNDSFVAFRKENNNVQYQWEIISRGIGRDTVVEPQFGDGMLSFRGSLGSMSTLSTRQLDLSRTVQPSLSFWYFHDTIPNEDYTDVRITVDGGTTYESLFSLNKYDPVYGWRQYTTDLPSHAVNQCVVIAFEAMEKTRSEDITQYIDRIYITAKQDIAVTDIFPSEYTACDLKNKDLKVVLSNLTDPVLDYDSTVVTLEIEETGQIFTCTLTTGSLGRSASDTITFAGGIDLDKGTYTFKAYFSSVFDADRNNDTLVKSITINPELSVQLLQISGGNINCLAAESDVFQRVNITNTGNMELSNIVLVLQIDTGDSGTPAYILLKDTCTNIIPVNSSIVYDFKNAYKATWSPDYYSRITACLLCDSSLISTVNEVLECVDTKDLGIISIDNLTSSVDRAGSSIQLRAVLRNRSDHEPFNDGVKITVLVENSQGIETAKFSETTGTIGTVTTVSYNFTNSYTVPNDTVYYLSVYIDSNDIYPHNDTVTLKRTTDYTDVNAIKSLGFVLGQNIPNPANKATRIDYSIPEAGKVIFHVHSITGQLLYSKSLEVKRGSHSLELNTTAFAAGIYFYSMEYKGQKLVKQLIID
ncbi:MAG: T9SS type A sorting domain-containing protein, partial [Bacteroidales bacterium]|nr:T9SS type A sorting domain-containing protein [Bacteroidales bacterium]